MMDINIHLDSSQSNRIRERRNSAPLHKPFVKSLIYSDPLEASRRVARVAPMDDLQSKRDKRQWAPHEVLRSMPWPAGTWSCVHSHNRYTDQWNIHLLQCFTVKNQANKNIWFTKIFVIKFLTRAETLTLKYEADVVKGWSRETYYITNKLFPDVNPTFEGWDFTVQPVDAPVPNTVFSDFEEGDQLPRYKV